MSDGQLGKSTSDLWRHGVAALQRAPGARSALDADVAVASFEALLQMIHEDDPNYTGAVANLSRAYMARFEYEARHRRPVDLHRYGQVGGQCARA